MQERRIRGRCYILFHQEPECQCWEWTITSTTILDGVDAEII